MKTDGSHLGTNSHLIDNETDIYISDNLLAFKADMVELNATDDSSKNLGKRLFTYNRFGENIGTSSHIVADKTEVFITDKLIAMTAMASIPGEELIKEENGVSTYNSVPLGMRLYTYTFGGKRLYTERELFEEASDIEVKSGGVFMLVPNYVQGALISDKDGVKTWESVGSGNKEVFYPISDAE